MTTYDNNDRYQYKEWPDLFSDKAVRIIENIASWIGATVGEKAKRIAARKRERNTIRALAELPENILHDIGWPDLYERQHRKDGN